MLIYNTKVKNSYSKTTRRKVPFSFAGKRSNLCVRSVSISCNNMMHWSHSQYNCLFTWISKSGTNKW